MLREGLPGIKLSEEDIASSFAGLRALVINGDEKSPSAVPREETILESASGLLSVAGGKLTTHREIAEKVVNRLMTQVGPQRPARVRREPSRCRVRARSQDADSNAAFTGEISRIPHGSLWNANHRVMQRIAAERPELSDAARAGMSRDRRGGDSRDSQRDGALRRRISWCAAPRWSGAIRFEAEAAAPAVARIMALELGWDSAREQAEVAGFVSDLKRRRAA